MGQTQTQRQLGQIKDSSFAQNNNCSQSQSLQQLKLIQSKQKECFQKVQYDRINTEIDKKLMCMNMIIFEISEISQSLQYRSVFDMKSSKRPQETLSLLLDALAICFQLKLRPIEYLQNLQITKRISISFWKNSYEESGKFIMGPNFDLQKSMKNFDLWSVNEETAQLLEPMMVDGQKWFNKQVFERVSKAQSLYCQWVYRVYDFERQNRQLKMLRKKSEYFESKLEKIKKYIQEIER